MLKKLVIIIATAIDKNEELAGQDFAKKLLAKGLHTSAIEGYIDVALAVQGPTAFTCGMLKACHQRNRDRNMEALAKSSSTQGLSSWHARGHNPHVISPRGFKP